MAFVKEHTEKISTKWKGYKNEEGEFGTPLCSYYIQLPLKSL